MATPEEIQSKLQKPGAGIPLIPRLVMKYWLLPKYSRATPWDVSVERFRKEGQKILELVAPLTPEQMETRVLIEPLRALEDSSRYWSVAMTIEHLMIVGGGMAEMIVQLSKGNVPPREVDTAKVKPRQNLSGKDAVEQFSKFVDANARRVMEEVQDRASKTRKAHPWFGGLTAHQWNFVMAFHQNTHCKQIERIIRGL